MSIINLKTNYQRVGYANEMKYITSAVRYSTLTQDDLIEFACENSGIPKAQMVSAFYAIMQQIQHLLLNGHSLTFGELGFFYLSAKTKATDTSKEAGVDAVEGLSLRFRQSKKMREMIKAKVVLTTITSSDSQTETGNDDDDEAVDSGDSTGGTTEGGDSNPL